MKDTALLI